VLVEVYFDDFKVTQTKSPIIQQDDYYPFGERFNSYSRENSIFNKKLYNAGSELQTDLDLNVYETQYRMYDPLMGRWWQIDPMVDEFYNLSPYNYSYNDPIRYNDPKGDCPLCKTVGRLVIDEVRELGGGNSAVEFLTGVASTFVESIYDPVTSQIDGTNASMSAANSFANGEIGEGLKTLDPTGLSSLPGTVMSAVNGDLHSAGQLTGMAIIAKGTASGIKGEVAAPKIGPSEAYNRTKHYGNTPTKADRKALGAGKDEVVDHKRSLVRHYYEGDGKGGKAGHNMTDTQRREFAKDRGNHQKQKREDSNKQGGQESNYSKQKKKEHGLD
jgi:RHS repeat-associated protein